MMIYNLWTPHLFFLSLLISEFILYRRNMNLYHKLRWRSSLRYVLERKLKKQRLLTVLWVGLRSSYNPDCMWTILLNFAFFKSALSILATISLNNSLSFELQCVTHCYSSRIELSLQTIVLPGNLALWNLGPERNLYTGVTAILGYTNKMCWSRWHQWLT